jgi:formate dehydrogenase
VDLGEAAERGITVAEITGSNTMSVAEHAAMQILVLVRNFILAYNDITGGGWSIGEIAEGSHDLEGKTVGIYGAGQIGQLIAARLKPFDVKMLYYKRSRLDTVEELSLDIRYATLER